MNAFTSSARIISRRVMNTGCRRAFQSTTAAAAAQQSRSSSSSVVSPLWAAAGLAVAAGVAVQQQQREEVRYAGIYVCGSYRKDAFLI